MSSLQSYREDFDQRNPFLLALLGLVSVSSQITGLRTRLEGSRDGATSAEPLDPTLCLLLGAASLSECIVRHAKASCAPPAQLEESPPPSAHSMRELLGR